MEKDMARITRQFLTGGDRYRDYGMVDVSFDVSMMSKNAAKNGTSVWIDIRAGHRRRQAVALSNDDVKELAIALLRCLDTDREFHGALKEYFQHGRRKRPIEA
jgi:hypothetical protein